MNDDCHSHYLKIEPDNCLAPLRLPYEHGNIAVPFYAVHLRPLEFDFGVLAYLGQNHSLTGSGGDGRFGSLAPGEHRKECEQRDGAGNQHVQVLSPFHSFA
jgi:hypothetical protein